MTITNMVVSSGKCYSLSIVLVIAFSCAWVNCLPVTGELSKTLGNVEDGANNVIGGATNLIYSSLDGGIDGSEDYTEGKCATSMCPGRTCASQQQSQSLPQQIKDYAEHLGHQLMCKIDPVASAQFGGLPIMYRGPLQSSSKEVAEVASFLLFKEWTQAFEATMKATTSTGKAWMLQNPISNISDMTQLDNLYNYFMNHYTIHDEVSPSTANTATSTTEDVVPSDDLPEGFWERDNITDPFLSINQRWNDDNIFAQSRLMATNPLQIQRVTSSSESDSDIGMSWTRLFPLLNKRDFDWEAEVRSVVGMSIKQAIATHRLYVVDFPLLAQVTADPHATSAFAGKKMLAPIALFAATNNRSAPLVTIAIQLGRNDTAPVYTPESGYFWWTIAKMYVNSADGLVSQISHHLVNAHLVSEAFAAGTCRELLTDHPVHVLLSPHFQGLIGINTQGFALLTSPEGAVTKIAGFGYEGMGELINLTYKHWTWNHTDFIHDLKKRGMYGGHESDQQQCKDCQKLLYYPYREDGLLLHKKIQSYVTEYIDHYYCTDEDVHRDSSVQRWAQYISESHLNKGFPASITSKVVLTDVLVRIIWVNSVHHAILNFPVKEFGSYVPAIAYTLRKSPYEWTSDHAPEEIVRASPENSNIFLKILPDLFVALNQTATASQLASLRLHGLFEDTGSFTSSFAKQLTARHRSALIDTSNPSSVQSVIAKRNKLRQRRGLLAYRYMQPKYLPNSIVI